MLPRPNTLDAIAMRHILLALDDVDTFIASTPSTVDRPLAAGALSYARNALLQAALADVSVEHMEPV